MKCVAEVTCQARDAEGKIRFFRKGQVFDFEECPPNFRPIAGEAAAEEEPVKIDFEKASEDELLEADYDIEELRDFITEKYDKKPGNRGKEKLVEMLLDCRYRDISDRNLDDLI